MKYILAILFGWVATSLPATGQTIKLVSISPASIKGDNKMGSPDDGTRLLSVTLNLSGKTKTPIHDSLVLQQRSSGSQPVLLDKAITLRKSDFPKRGSWNRSYPVRVRLSPLPCLIKDEKFQIARKADPGDTAIVTITRFTTLPDSPILLKDDSSRIETKEGTTPGLQSIPVTLILSGKPPNTDTKIEFGIPSYLPYTTDPEIIQDIPVVIPKTAFDSSECPVEKQIAVIVQLKKTAKPGEERIPILLKDDNDHAHTLIIRTDPKATGDKVEKAVADSGYTFACNKRNFSFRINAEGSGATVVVTDLAAGRKDSYRFNGIYHTGDFATWFVNVFATGNPKDTSRNGTMCAAYLAERVNEQLAFSKVTDPSGKTADASGKTTATDPSSKTPDTKTDTGTQKGGAQKTNAEKSNPETPDTLKTKLGFTYSDTTHYDVHISKTGEKSVVILSNTAKNGQGGDSATVDGNISYDTFSKTILQLLKKSTGQDSVDQSKLSPPLAQLYTDYSKTADTKKSASSPDFKQQLADILNNDSVTRTKVGALYLKDSLIDLYGPGDIVIKRTRIDSVTFTIEAGKLIKRMLYVETKDGTFINRDAPISVIRINDRGTDRLYSADPTDQTYVLLKDVLNYKALKDYSPDDAEGLVLSPKKPAHILSAASNLNSLINFALFTDLAGLVGRRANGLINANVYGHFITNTRNIRNDDITPFAFIDANVMLSKFDSKFRSLDSTDIKANPINHLDTLDRMQLERTAWLKGSLKVNLVSVRAMSSQYFQANAGIVFNVANADSFFRKDYDLVFLDYYAEATYSIKRLSNFGMDLTSRWMLQYVSGRSRFNNTGAKFIYNPQVAFYYYPVNQSNDQVYLRFNYFAGHQPADNNFYQLQVGYKTSLKLSK